MPSLAHPATVGRVTIKKGLEGQDANLDLLESYFHELKAVTVEPSPPEIDLLTFAACTHYFGVITLKPGAQQDGGDEDAEGEPEEDSLDAGYVASPPPSSTSSAASFTSARSAVRFEPKDSISSPGGSHIHPEEKVLKWREAFLAQLQEVTGEEDPQLLSKGKMRESRNVEFIPKEVNAPDPSISNDPDDYINWPDDIPSDQDEYGLPVQDEPYHETEAYSRFHQAEHPTLLGREILEPEQFNSPVGKMPDIRTNLQADAIVYEEAIKFRDVLRAQRIRSYQQASASRPVFFPPPLPQSKPIGIIYLASSQTVDDHMHRGQLNIGIYVAPDYIEQQGLVQAIREVINEAFQDSSCHRVQAIVVDHETKLHTLELYTSSGLSREGIGRREFFSPVTHEWKDVFYFAILDTDWMNNSSQASLVRPGLKTLWDDLFVCQQREREELLKMEKTLKRNNSIETIRDKAPIASSIAATSRSETSSVANSSKSAASTDPAACNESPKRRRLVKEWGRKSRTPSVSTSSNIGTFDTMSAISSEWEFPARQAFVIPASNGASPPITSDVSASTGNSTGSWVKLDVSK